jgi:serine/threonine protein kinase
LKPVQDHPNREQLTAFMWGQLGEADHTEIADHIEGCDACCLALREIPDDAFLAHVRAANTPTNAGDEPAPTLSRDQRVPKELIEHPRYKVGRFLGAGGMGAVYQAEHRLMDRVVALKILHRDLAQHPRVVDRFRQEVKAAARLSHPNIVTAYDAEQAGDVHFLVMEYVDGVSLAHFIAKKGPLEISTACNFARQAARGLQHAFETGMVHRDIKPHNLMLTRKGQIKILDFGLARLASETRADLGLPELPDRPGLTKLGDILGTPDYMAPEQVVNSSQADIRADIFGLGCTLYYLLVGRSPFAKDFARAALVSKKYRPPRPITELRDDLPAELVAVLNKMLAKDVGQRYQTPAEVVKALTPFIKPAAASPTAPEIKTSPRQAPTVTDDGSRGDSQGFLAQCPFCSARIRIPAKKQGASIPCSNCGSYFTAAGEDKGQT